MTLANFRMSVSPAVVSMTRALTQFNATKSVSPTKTANHPAGAVAMVIALSRLCAWVIRRQGTIAIIAASASLVTATRSIVVVGPTISHVIGAKNLFKTIHLARFTP